MEAGNEGRRPTPRAWVRKLVRRAERTRRCGAAIPRELWRAAKDSKVLRALEEHLETPAASRSAELDPEEDNRMAAWCGRRFTRA